MRQASTICLKPKSLKRRHERNLSVQLRTLGTGTQLFITERFHRDKAQAERTINFVRSIEKSARDYIGSCKKTLIERTNTNHERNIKHRKKFKHLISSVI